MINRIQGAALETLHRNMVAETAKRHASADHIGRLDFRAIESDFRQLSRALNLDSTRYQIMTLAETRREIKRMTKISGGN